MAQCFNSSTARWNAIRLASSYQERLCSPSLAICRKREKLLVIYHFYSIGNMPYSSHPLPCQVFKKIAKKGKTSTGCFYRFKLHLIMNDKGKILAYMLTPGNVEIPVSICLKAFLA
ncbi:hypothetical protein NEOC65_001060 [Neochlamydia sp. AcF65]|uniref:transposase n=1 Tax=Neochlamydia sp. AcF65 TaxID=2795735 RepID=UPI001BCA16A6|nr:transposase [Neochlamydia sp. AcF65]MBS4165983.1 hypothetical protein [Neochlamydia sp. AcF65]